jgi:hypothetical protein
MSFEPFESVLLVFQNPVKGRVEAYDDWYTNTHIRDAMRLDGAIATQRFIASEKQLTLDGQRVDPGYFAHTIYEWESAAKSVAGHEERAGTPAMQISRDGSFTKLRDFFYRPRFLSHGWSRAAGFRRGRDILTAMIQPAASEAEFIDWFQTRHVPATLALPGVGSIGLFSLHEEQSLPYPSEFPLAAVYGLTDVDAALQAWGARHDRRDETSLSAMAVAVEATCWQPRIPRLRAEEVADPTPHAAAEQERARLAYSDRYLSREELERFLEG